MLPVGLTDQAIPRLGKAWSFLHVCGKFCFNLPTFVVMSDFHHMGVNQKKSSPLRTVTLRTLEIYGHEHSKRVLWCP